MRNIIICMLFLIITISLQAQRSDTLNLVKSDNVAYENYVLVFSENPNEFFKKNINKLFSEREIDVLKEYGLIDFHLIIGIEDNVIVELFSPDNENLDDSLLSKVHTSFLTHIRTKAHQLVKKDTKEELVYLITSIDLRERGN